MRGVFEQVKRCFVPLSLVALAVTGSGCLMQRQGAQTWQADPQVIQTPPVVIYQDSTGPMSYQSRTGADVGRRLPVRRVQGRACQSGLSLGIGALFRLGRTSGDGVRALAVSAGWGDAGYREAFAEAERYAEGRPLFDVRADINVEWILGIWRQQCIVVDAGVAGDEG